MKTNITELSKGIYRLSVAPTDRFEFNHFLIVDEKCMLIHTGGKKIFSVLCQLVEDLINLNRLEYIAFSHFESDECGSLNEWLQVAPNAVPLIGEIGKASMDDFSNKLAMVVSHLQIIDLGRHKIQVLETPHIPHGWEACLFYETTNGILFSSDLGAQPGINTPVSDRDQTSEILKFQKDTGFLPEGESSRKTFDLLKNLKINFMATMHGSVLPGDQVIKLFKALD